MEDEIGSQKIKKKWKELKFVFNELDFVFYYL